MKPQLHMGHALAGIFLLAALTATVQAPAPRTAPRQALSQLPGLPSIANEPLPAAGSLAGYLAANPACREVGNGCEICVRGAGNSANCSTPGIACVPTGWQCREVNEKAASAPLAPAPLPQK